MPSEIMPLMSSIDPKMDLERLSNEQLQEIVDRCNQLTESILLLKGRALALMAKRGVRIGRDTYTLMLQRIGDGSLIPQVYIQFEHSRSMMRKLSQFPLAEQSRLMDGIPIEVADLSGGEVICRMIPLDELDAKQVRQVFNGPSLRTIEQQVRWIKRMEIKHRDIDSDPRIIRRGQKWCIGGVALSKKQLNDLAEKL